MMMAMVFVIDLLKDKISLLERQLIEKNSLIDFLVKHQMSPVATWSGVDCENKVLNSQSADVVKMDHYRTTTQYRQR